MGGHYNALQVRQLREEWATQEECLVVERLAKEGHDSQGPAVLHVDNRDAAELLTRESISKHSDWRGGVEVEEVCLIREESSFGVDLTANETEGKELRDSLCAACRLERVGDIAGFVWPALSQRTLDVDDVATDCVLVDFIPEFAGEAEER